MLSRCRGIVPALIVLALAGVPTSARADIFVNGGFGANGTIGVTDFNSITFGSDEMGTVAQLDGFVNINSAMYPGNTGVGNSYDMAYGLPPGVTLVFTAATVPNTNGEQFQLNYHFLNNTGGNLPRFQFLVYLDSSIPDNNTNQFATVSGQVGLTQPGKIGPTSFQADDINGTILTNAENAMLDDTNHRAAPTVGDVGMALGFVHGDLAAGQEADFTVLLTDNLATLAGLNLTAHGSTLPDTLTVSGFVTVPEPSIVALAGILLLCGLSAGSLSRRSRDRRRSVASAGTRRRSPRSA
jgi:hypothetical protein